MANLRVGFTGTQHGMMTNQLDLFKRSLGRLLLGNTITEFHHGDCVGSDAQSHDMFVSCWGHSAYNTIYIHPPIIKTKRAHCHSDHILPAKDYIDRNHDIVDNTDILIATPSTNHEILQSGTWATIRYARKQLKPIIIIYPSGEISTERKLPT